MMNAATRNRKRPVMAWMIAAIGAGILLSPDRAAAGHIRVLARHRPGRVWVPPVYETRPRTITRPAAYEDRERTLWREPVYELRQVRIELSAEIVNRRVPQYDLWGRLAGYELVREIVSPAREAWRQERVLVRAGFHETILERICVRPETTKVVYEQVLVRPGFWRASATVKVRRGPRHRGVVKVREARRAHDHGMRLAVRFGG